VVQEAVARTELQRRGVTRLRTLEVRLRLHSRSVYACIIPAFHLCYHYGEKQTGSIEITRQMHEALVPAVGVGGEVVAERHVSPRKAQAVAATAAVAAKAAAAATVAGGAVTAAEIAAVVGSVDTAFVTFIVASVAGVVARGLSGLRREWRATALEAKAEAVRGAYMPGGMGPGNIESAQDLWLRADLEWQRWAEAEQEEWSPSGRKESAERLLREQHARRCGSVLLS
jgi:hypothetical protein